MRNAIAAAMVVAMKLSAQQQDHFEDVTLRITSAGVSGFILYRTKPKVSEILRQVGVHVVWKSANAAHQIHECSSQAVDISDIDILIQDRSQPDDHPGALAYSLPFNKAGNRVVIFYDRVLTSMNQPSPELLAHVIAHEIGHMLIGTLSHAPAGVMRAHWQRHDLYAMRAHPLSFDSYNAGMIAMRFELQHKYCGVKELHISSSTPAGGERGEE